MSENETFMSLALSGKVMMDEIDDYVDLWHESPGGIALHEYLGFDMDEYELWVSSPDSLGIIFYARKYNQTLEDVANDNVKEMRIAARTNDSLRIKRLETWLKKRKDKFAPG